MFYKLFLYDGKDVFSAVGTDRDTHMETQDPDAVQDITQGI